MREMLLLLLVLWQQVGRVGLGLGWMLWMPTLTKVVWGMAQAALLLLLLLHKHQVLLTLLLLKMLLLKLMLLLLMLWVMMVMMMVVLVLMMLRHGELMLKMLGHHTTHANAVQSTRLWHRRAWGVGMQITQAAVPGHRFRQ
jgi:hypothetical protein